jgi:hypothetical protein
MRVGLLRPVAPEVIDGGYTIEQEIFERLLECAPTSKHEFVVFEDLDGDNLTFGARAKVGKIGRASHFRGKDRTDHRHYRPRWLLLDRAAARTWLYCPWSCAPNQ